VRNRACRFGAQHLDCSGWPGSAREEPTPTATELGAP